MTKVQAVETLATGELSLESPPVPAQAGLLRILQVVNRIWMGGTEYALLNMIDGLSDGHFEHRICAVRGCDSNFPRMAQVAGKIFVAGAHSSNFQFPLFRLTRIMRSYRPHIVHSRNWGAIEAIFAARLARVPIVVHSEHGYELEMLSGLPRRQRLLRRSAYSLTDAIFAVTGELRDFHARQAWISPERFQVIYNGVDIKRFQPQPELRIGIRQQLGIPTGRFVVGTVGRMVPIKDHGTLLRAAESLIENGVNLHLLLVGSGPQLASHEAYVRRSNLLRDRTHFAGRSERVPEMLQAMDVFVLPSISEGMSNTLLEAMACGLPTIATRVGGNQEVVAEGQGGWLFSPGDSVELKEHLRLLATNKALRDRAGLAGRMRAVEKFSLNTMVANYRSLYLRLAERKGLKADQWDMRFMGHEKGTYS